MPGKKGKRGKGAEGGGGLTGGGIGGGAAAGAATGAVAGPIGMAVGAIAGAGLEAAAANEESKQADRADPRLKRRRLGSFVNQLNQNLNNKQRALIAMAQAHQNFASSF